MSVTTPEEIVERRRSAARQYNQSEKGKLSRARAAKRECPEARRKRDKRRREAIAERRKADPEFDAAYRAKERERDRRYRATENGKERDRRYAEAHRDQINERNRLYHAGHGRDVSTRAKAAYSKTPNGMRITREAVRRRYLRNHMTRAKADELWRVASKAAPAYLPPDTRDDIIGDLITEVMSGKILITEIAKKAAAIISANRKHNSKWGPQSLDAERWDGSGQTLHDTISEGLWQ